MENVFLAIEVSQEILQTYTYLFTYSMEQSPSWEANQ